MAPPATINTSAITRMTGTSPVPLRPRTQLPIDPQAGPQLAATDDGKGRSSQQNVTGRFRHRRPSRGRLERKLDVAGFVSYEPLKAIHAEVSTRRICERAALRDKFHDREGLSERRGEAAQKVDIEVGARPELYVSGGE